MDNLACELKPVKQNIEVKKNTKKALSRAWIRCISGRKIDLLEPSPLDVEISDLSLSLSRICRWAGMTNSKYSYSVAQHSVLVSDILKWTIESNQEKYDELIKQSGYSKNYWILAALCHDCSEGYLGGNLCGPAKNMFANDLYRKVEKRIQEAIHIAIGLPPILPKEIKKAIKEADRASSYAEAVLIAGFDKKEADGVFGGFVPLKDETELPVLSPEMAKKVFLERYETLKNLIEMNKT
jgi:5'-deoxynucleotidase YfbR-like HD superfamily hydrolase